MDILLLNLIQKLKCETNLIHLST